MSVSSEDQSLQLFNCKWAWCRSTFSNNAGLVHHVHDHVRRAIPVRRRDISMIRRAEEGKGESLKISELMADMYSYSSRESISHKPEPSSSLPSPPASSSPALHSPHNIEHSPGPAPSPSPPSLEHRKKLVLIKSKNSDDISRQTSPLLRQNLPVNQITTFASLSSPEHERPPFSFEMPDSPSFSSLVERPNKRKMISSTPDSMLHHKTHLNQTHPIPPPHPPSSSFESQNSVEARLTQTEDDDGIDQDEDLDIHCHASNGLLSEGSDIPLPSFGMISEHDGLQWEPSQPAEEHLMSDSTFQSQSNAHHHLENLPVMSQPSSQPQLHSEFPFHFHDRPHGTPSRAPHTILTGLDPSAAVPLSPPSPVSSPAFAVSTPVRQNWYQPHVKRRKRSTCNDKSSDPSPLKADASVAQTKLKKMFRSGTLQIKPASLSEESKSMDIDSDANRQNNLATPQSPYDLDIFSQSSQDSSDLSQINSYPALQTQAPYRSQSLTQF